VTPDAILRQGRLFPIRGVRRLCKQGADRVFGLLYVLIPAVPLVIPVAILLGHRRPTGSLIACATGALGIFAAFWLILGASTRSCSPRLRA
jgi:hypothetical protein